MASIPPPDPSSPGGVAGASFPTARKGLDPAAVRAFLSQVSQEMGRLQHERDRLTRDLDDARQQAQAAAPEHMDEATVAAKLGEEAARVLSTAHEASAQIRAKAEEASARLLRDAELEAARERGDAEVEAAHRRQDAEAAAEAEIEAAKAEGRAMISEARELRERIFADLTRRRDLAQAQIETLQTGNRQVMHALRGARLELDAILTGLEAETAEDMEDDGLDSLDLPGRGADAGGPETAVLVLGEMDLPAAIVERHLESVPSPPEDVEEDDVEEDDVEEAGEDDEPVDGRRGRGRADHRRDTGRGRGRPRRGDCFGRGPVRPPASFQLGGRGPRSAGARRRGRCRREPNGQRGTRLRGLGARG